MPLPKGFKLEPDIRTGAVAGGPQKVGYDSGTSNPPNGGQITDVDNPEPNDIRLPKGFRLETPESALPAGATGSLPAQPKVPIPAALQGPPSVLRNFASAAGDIALPLGDVGIGALKGLGSDVSNGDAAIHSIPLVGPLLTPGVTDQARTELRQMVTPSNTAQSVGKGIEQAGEFLLPGLGEEAAGAKLAELAPGLERAAAPLGRIAVSALGSGAVNKLQGGGFGTGALMGGIAGGVGEGAKFIAPKIAEAGLKITKLDRAYKKPGAIGRAILDETTGVTPGAVAESAQARMGELNPQVDAIVDRASVRPNPVRGLLPGPMQEIPLGKPYVPGMPGDLLDAEPFPPQNVAQTRVIRNGAGQILPRSERITAFPNENGVMLPARNPYNGRMLPQKIEKLPFTREGFMAGGGDELPPVIDQRVGPGVLLRPFEGESGPIPSTLPNRSASLRGPRAVLSNATGKAAAQGERTTLGQIEPMVNHLNFTVGGEPIPANITPREMLDLERGFGNEFISRWNPETMTGVKGTAANVYHAMGNELDRVVPEAQELRSRISPLITVAKRGKSAELNAPLSQRLAGRLTAHTGALTGAVGGGIYGYEHGGAPAAIRDAAAGFILPELLGSPTWQLGAARAFDSGAPATLGRLVGGGLIQATRKRTK